MLRICQSRTSPSTDQSFVKELAKPMQAKLFLIPNAFGTKPFKKNKKCHAQPDTNRQENTRTMTAKTQSYSDFQTRWTRTPAPNRRLAQWRVQWLIEHTTSHQLLWCIDSFVLRNPPLRQAPKRYRLF